MIVRFNELMRNFYSSLFSQIRIELLQNENFIHCDFEFYFSSFASIIKLEITRTPVSRDIQKMTAWLI